MYTDGMLNIDENSNLGLAPGKYIALLTHSGSRGLGARIADHYTKVAMSKRKLDPAVKQLAWLDLDEDAGAEYWHAMNLCGDYAKACHDSIHYLISKYMSWKPVKLIENNHNFAWKEIHKGEEVIVHRKGATPAGLGVWGIIPGSMATPGYVVTGKGNEASINSASHGAGRAMSRTKAKATFTNSAMKKFLKEQRVELIGGSLDEAPFAYKDIETVIAAQKDLIEVKAKLTPRIVRMDDGDEDI